MHRKVLASISYVVGSLTLLVAYLLCSYTVDTSKQENGPYGRPWLLLTKPVDCCPVAGSEMRFRIDTKIG